VPCVLRYMAAQHKQGSTRSTPAKIPGSESVQSSRNLVVNTRASRLFRSDPFEPESPTCQSPTYALDIKVGYYSQYGDWVVNVYAYLKRGKVVFRTH
jgi:hypothetical protein